MFGNIITISNLYLNLFENEIYSNEAKLNFQRHCSYNDLPLKNQFLLLSMLKMVMLNKFMET